MNYYFFNKSLKNYQNTWANDFKTYIWIGITFYSLKDKMFLE